MSDPIRITGELSADAEVRYTPGQHSHAILFLQIKPAVGFPFVVQQDCGDEPARFSAAEAKQRLLRRGVTVTVYARGITPRTDHGHAVLKLEGVTDVIPNTAAPGSNRYAE